MDCKIVAPFYAVFQLCKALRMPNFTMYDRCPNAVLGCWVGQAFDGGPWAPKRRALTTLETQRSRLTRAAQVELCNLFGNRHVMVPDSKHLYLSALSDGIPCSSVEGACHPRQDGKRIHVSDPSCGVLSTLITEKVLPVG